MLRLLIYLILLGLSGSFLFGLFTLLLLPKHLHNSQKIQVDKSREEVYYFLRNSQYFPLWQVFENGARAVNKYNFISTKSGNWDSVSVENPQSFSAMTIVEDKPLKFLKLRYYMRKLEYPLDISINLEDIGTKTQITWSYDLPIIASLWDINFQAWNNAYQFYNLNKNFNAFIPDLKNKLSKLNIVIPFELTYHEQNLNQNIFWIYADDTISNPNNSEQLHFKKSQILYLYLRNKPEFIQDTIFYWQQDGTNIRVGQLFYPESSNPNQSFDILDKINSVLNYTKLSILKKYQVISFAFSGSRLDLLDSLHQHFPATLIKIKNSLTLERLYQGENQQKYPFRSHISWIHLSKF